MFQYKEHVKQKYDMNGTTVRIPFEVSDGVEELIEDLKMYGIRKYVTKTDFVRAAIVKLMEEEFVSLKKRRAADGELIAQ
jgi:Arc/MetJ-type ribon-helix-helix transcriptional regulator